MDAPEDSGARQRRRAIVSDIEHALELWDRIEARYESERSDAERLDQLDRLVGVARHDPQPDQALVALAGQTILWLEARDASRETDIASGEAT
jgi:hypothetical protein